MLDGVIAEEVLKALQPAELELALAALRELESRDQSILRQWQMRLAEYEAALAERRYQEVDPANFPLRAAGCQAAPQDDMLIS